jgi:hypothetical protein
MYKYAAIDAISIAEWLEKSRCGLEIFIAIELRMSIIQLYLCFTFNYPQDIQQVKKKHEGTENFRNWKILMNSMRFWEDMVDQCGDIDVTHDCHIL